MAIETRFKIEFEDYISDNFEDDTPEEEMKALIEEHLRDYCREHNIDREHIRLLSKIDF